MMNKKRTNLILFFIILFGIGARLVTINTYSQWFDTSYSFLASEKPLSWLLFSNPEVDVHPPLSYVAGHFFMKIFGTSPDILNYLTLLVGIAAMFTIFFVAKKWYDENVALVTTFLFATSLTMIKYVGQEARMYCWIVLLVTLSFHFLKEQKWFWFVLVTALMEYFHYYAVFIIIAHLILVYSLQIDWKKFLKAQFFVYVLMIPVVLYFIFQNYGTQGMWLKNPLAMTIPSAFLFQLFIAGNTAFYNVHSLLPFLFFGIIFCFLFLQKFGRLELGMLFAWFFGISVFLILAYSPLHLPYHHRFALMFCPLLFLLLGRALSNVLLHWKALGIGLLCFWVGVQGVMYYQYYSVPDVEIAHASEFLKSYCLNHSIILHESPFSLLPLKVYQPDCIHILETDITLNQLRTAGGAVIDSKLINNASYVPDFYVLSEVRAFPAYASGKIVFNESGLLIMKVEKDSFVMRESNVSRVIKRLDTSFFSNFPFDKDLCCIAGECGNVKRCV
jgi:uncharacterized membrane protein